MNSPSARAALTTCLAVTLAACSPGAPPTAAAPTQGEEDTALPDWGSVREEARDVVAQAFEGAASLVRPCVDPAALPQHEDAPAGLISIGPGSWLLTVHSVLRLDPGCYGLTRAVWWTPAPVTQAALHATMKRRGKPVCPDCMAGEVTWPQALRYLNARSLAERLTPCYEVDTGGRPACLADDTCSIPHVAFDAACTGYRLPTALEWSVAMHHTALQAPYQALLTRVSPQPSFWLWNHAHAGINGPGVERGLDRSESSSEGVLMSRATGSCRAAHDERLTATTPRCERASLHAREAMESYPSLGIWPVRHRPASPR